MGQLRIFDMLREAARLGASDVHLISSHSPMVRVSGLLIPFPDMPVLSPDQCGSLIYELLDDGQRARLEREWTLDFSLKVETSRFRGNVFYQREGLGAVLRIIPVSIPTPEQLDISPVIVGLTDLMRGLVLVTGATGSGKTTTLASLINTINHKRRAHIVTIEDPIEFVYQNKNSVISQREVGQHAPSFAHALKYVLRQDPDVILVGEMRDLETVSAAITIAETGHLVFATLHTQDAAQSIDRMIDVFPSTQHAQVRSQLAGTLEAVIAQHLVPRKDNLGRIAAREVMIVNPAISNLIRQGKIHEIDSAIELGTSAGMTSMDRALGDLVKRNLISEEEALRRVTNPESPLARAFRRKNG